MSLARMVTVALVAAVLTASSAPVAAQASMVSSDYMRISTDDVRRECLDSSGRLVVWDDHRYFDEGSPTAHRDIRGYDVKTGEQVVIASTAADERNPSVSGTTVVWTEAVWVSEYAMEYDIRGMDYATGQLYAIACEPGDQAWARVSGDVVVWEDSHYDPKSRPTTQIVGKRLSTEETFAVTPDRGAYSGADIEGDWVVYSKAITQSDHDVFAYNIKTRATKRLSQMPGRQYSPRIDSHGMVAWHSEATGPDDSDVMGRSVYGGSLMTFASGPGAQSLIGMGGNLVVYGDSRAPGGYLVLGYDLLSGTRFGVAPATARTHYYSTVEDGVLAWIESTPTGSDVYMSRPAILDQVAGRDRFSTAVVASRESFPDGADSAIIASGMSWADALAGAGLAGVEQPLLLTAAGTLPEVTAAELRRLGVKNVTVLGGTASVSPAVEAQLDTIVADNVGSPGIAVEGDPVRRLAGRTRIEAATRIASEVAARPGWDGTVLVAASTTFADALAASPMAAKAGLPLLLATPSGLTSDTMAAISEMGAKRAVILGGTASVPAGVDAALKERLGTAQVRRLAGRNRYSTAVAIAGYGSTNYGLSWDGVGIASGTAFADAMAGGLLKGKAGSVMLLTDGRALSADTAAALNARRATIRSGSYIGGSLTVTKPVRGKVREILR